MCAVLEISRRAYYKYRNADDPDYLDYTMIKKVFDDSKGTYGYRRITEGLKIEYGGGKGASKMLQKLGIEPKMIEGRRITDQVTLEVVTGLYAGNLNKQIVVQLQQFGTNAVGLSGADGNVIKGIKRPVKTIDYGFVGVSLL